MAELPRQRKASMILICHILEDQFLFFDALSGIIDIDFIIAIPYSLDKRAYSVLAEKYKIFTPTLTELMNRDFLQELILSNISPVKEYIISEIGGYCAPFINNLAIAMGGKLLGVIEDTESGHKKYLQQDKIMLPIVSVARSILKEKEDFLVGERCLSSFCEMLSRGNHDPVDTFKMCGIFGFGKIGRSIAHALRKRCFHNVLIYDHNPFQRLQACVEGFQIPHKEVMLQKADYIFGATGNCSLSGEDFYLIKNGASLVSCSSKDIEYDLKSVFSLYQSEFFAEGIQQFRSNKNSFYLLAEGRPINFWKHPKLIGPILLLVQAEIILATYKILSGHFAAGLNTIPNEEKEFIAHLWLKNVGRLD